MKKLIILLILFFTGIITAQVQSSISRWNSTAQELDSAGVFTGTEELTRGYNSLSVTIRSDSAGTYKILFGNSTSITTANAIKTWSFSYTAGDTLHTKHVPIVAPYYKVVYTNSADTQNVFLLTTMLHQGHNLPTNSSAEIQVADATVEATLTNIEADADSTVDMVTSMNTSLDNIEADADSTVDMVTAIEANTDGIETKLDSLDASSTRIETKLDNANVKLDSLDASNTRIEGYVDGLEVKADTSNARIQEIKLDIENLKIYNAPATKYVGLTDTVTTRTDTTTFTGTWVEGEIKADDSCEVAIDGSFPSGQTYIITETTAVKLPKWAIATSDKLFVRRYGGAGTVRFYLRLNSY